MSATVAAAVKAAIVILSNEEARKKVGWGIDSALTVCLVCSDGHEFEFSYPLTPAEQVQLWNQMDAYCHQQNGQNLGETRSALLREQAEEGLEIRL